MLSELPSGSKALEVAMDLFHQALMIDAALACFGIAVLSLETLHAFSGRAAKRIWSLAVVMALAALLGFFPASMIQTDVTLGTVLSLQALDTPAG